VAVRTTPPFRADHVGSLLRPQALLQARQEFAAGRLPAEELNASEYISLDQLCLSPQCGFASTVEGNALTYDDEVAKLALIVETAEEVWG
jgi:methionine synthase II (cobalamin-independent)